MLGTIIISALTFLSLTASILFFSTIKIGRAKTGTYWIVAMLGATLLILFRLVPVEEIWQGLTRDSTINPLKILVLFFSMTFLSILLDEVGFFRFLAKKAVRFAGTNQVALFSILYVLVAVLTIFTSNDIVILSLTPFICFFCKNTGLNPLPYLVEEFAAANTWSMMLIIGNPTNIYLATSANISFLTYFKVMALPTLAAGIVEFLLIFLLFRKQLKEKAHPKEDDFDIKSRADLIVGVIHLAVCLLFLVISDYLGLEMWLISAVCAVSLLLWVVLLRLLRRDGWIYLTRSVKRLPWQLIPFVLSMFVIVIGLNYQGVSKMISEFLGDQACIWTYGGASFLSANLINNIPMSILFSTLPSTASTALYWQAIYASIVGSNIGAFLTPIGALAGIMFTELTERYQVKYGFKEFVKYGALVAVPTMGTALLLLSVVLR